jgi:hypothetical protein
MWLTLAISKVRPPPPPLQLMTPPTAQPPWLRGIVGILLINALEDAKKIPCPFWWSEDHWYVPPCLLGLTFLAKCKMGRLVCVSSGPGMQNQTEGKQSSAPIEYTEKWGSHMGVASTPSAGSQMSCLGTSCEVGDSFHAVEAHRRSSERFVKMPLTIEFFGCACKSTHN